MAFNAMNNHRRFAGMSMLPPLLTTDVQVVDLDPSETPYVAPTSTARDGTPARRPGDLDPVAKSDDEPLFSTDPLRGS